MNKQLETDFSSSERIVKDLMYCARFLRSNTEGKGSRRRVLHFLKERGPITQRELLEEMGIRASSLSELLGKLEDKGYITKEKSGPDKRNYYVAITSDGIQALAEMQAQHQAAMVDLLSGLSEEDLSCLSSSLHKLRSLWSERDHSMPAPPHRHKHSYR